MSNQKNKKNSKIEKQFYSEKNFNLLEDVIVGMINKNEFNGDHKTIIFNTMEKVYKQQKINNNLNRYERKELLTFLNKNVLATLASQINKNKSVQNNTSTVNQGFVPAQESGFGHPFNNIQVNNKNTQNYSNDFQSQYLQNFGNNREIKTFYSREFTQPSTISSLHPRQNIENFPAPESVNSSTNNTNVMFKKIEEERTNENISRRPKPIDFTLPQNTMENNTNKIPENKFKELMKNREKDDDTIKNIFPNTKKENISIVEPFSETNSFISKNTQNNFEYNSFFNGLDNTMLEKNEIIDKPNEQIKNSNKQNYPTSSFSRNNLNQINIQNKNIQEEIITNLPNNLIDSQNIIHDRKDEEYIENEIKTFYITILSKYRNTYNNPYPTNFTLNISENKNNKNFVKIEDEIIFESNKSPNDDFYIFKNKKIVSIECLDVVIPKINYILNEPYIWLCINEWNSSNYGPGIPENAFSRLKAFPSSHESPFITMKSHLLERQNPEKINDKLTLKLLTSDGEPIEIDDRKDIIKIENNLIEVSENHNIVKDDLLYIYSLYSNQVTGFYPNVYIYDINSKGKLNNTTLSFRLFIDKDANDPNNKIGIFGDDKEKINIFASKYLSKGDILFLEYIKTKKVSGNFEILDVKNDIITIKFPQTSRQFIPKKITKIGFIKRKNEGYVSYNKKDINYKGGVFVDKVENNKIYLKNNYEFEKNNSYFFLNRKNQISYMFRITYLE